MYLDVSIDKAAMSSTDTVIEISLASIAASPSSGLGALGALCF